MKDFKKIVKDIIGKDLSIDDNHKAIEGNNESCTQCGKQLKENSHTYNTWPIEKRKVLCGNCSAKALGRLTGR